eukprot:814650-Amorphochlora_amoeboformis.AAC.1
MIWRDVTLGHGTTKTRYYRVLTGTTGYYYRMLRSPNDLQNLHRSGAIYIRATRSFNTVQTSTHRAAFTDAI